MSMNEIDNQEESLDLFSAEFFGQSSPQEDVPVKEETSNIKEVAAEEATPEEDTHNEETDEEEDDKEPTPEPKKKSSYQDRINELTAARREAERREIALQNELAEIKNMLAKKDVPETKVDAPKEPTPDDVNEDGTEKYPLGEFDPKYTKDLATFTANQIIAKHNAEMAALEEQRKVEQQTSALRAEWETKLTAATEKYDDYAEKSSALINSLSTLDPVYSEQLANAIMSLDNGPDVLYYLANNPTEAMNIVNAGPVKAAIAFGRIDSRFESAKEQKEQARPKISKAPTPPVTNKGASASIPIPDDTDDLDAFWQKFQKR